jgi:cysteine rich repeat protein
MTPQIRVAALFAVLLLPAVGVAQTPAAPPSAEATEMREKMRAACSADVQKLCGQIERGKGQMRACLEEHASDLSEACRAARAERAALKAKSKS